MEAEQEPLRRWGLRSALTALLLVVVCESPFLASIEVVRQLVRIRRSIILVQ